MDCILKTLFQAPQTFKQRFNIVCLPYRMSPKSVQEADYPRLDRENTPRMRSISMPKDVSANWRRLDYLVVPEPEHN